MSALNFKSSLFYNLSYSCRCSIYTLLKKYDNTCALNLFSDGSSMAKISLLIKGNEILPGQGHCLLAGLQCDL